MPAVVRIPITNIFADGDYTGRIFVGAQKKPMNVLLDTGSSTLALSGHKYRPNIEKGDRLTKFAQNVAYGDKSSWAGAVIRTGVAIGDVTQVTVPDANVAIAYNEAREVFGNYDGILGLAYAALDDAALMAQDTWPKRYSLAQLTAAPNKKIEPYLIQLARKKIVSDKMSFYTRRSQVHQGPGRADDPLNHGWMVVGGGEESTDLYSGKFQTAKVLSAQWYSTHLKAIIVGDTPPIHVPKLGAFGNPTNSIVDSGTSCLVFGHHLLKAVLSRFDAGKRAQLAAAIPDGRHVRMSDLDLAAWPHISFVLQGETDDIILRVRPGDYWQVNSPRVGAATAAIGEGDEGDNILGLPLMNGYFTIFDGEADRGKGAIKFAAIKS